MRHLCRVWLLGAAALGMACASRCSHTPAAAPTQKTQTAPAEAPAEPVEAPSEAPPSTVAPDLQKAWEGLSIGGEPKPEGNPQDPNAAPGQSPAPVPGKSVSPAKGNPLV